MERGPKAEDISTQGATDAKVFDLSDGAENCAWLASDSRDAGKTCQDAGSLEVIEVRVLAMPLPRLVNALITRTALRLKISAYSAATAPSSLARKVIIFFIACLAE